MHAHTNTVLCPYSGILHYKDLLCYCVHVLSIFKHISVGYQNICLCYLSDMSAGNYQHHHLSLFTSNYGLLWSTNLHVPWEIWKNITASGKRVFLFSAKLLPKELWTREGLTITLNKRPLGMPRRGEIW